MKLMHVVGTRPNFPKLAPVFRAARSRGLRQLVVHTGQHYDDAMSGNFFRELDIPEPEVNLAVGSGSHGAQTARILERIEPVLEKEMPDWLVVYGDVNSTMAATLAASKLRIRIAHVEAGLRSFDRDMPEEINRLVTDRLADLLLTPSRDAGEQLLREGEDASRIAFVGNVMIDSLFHALPNARATGFRKSLALRDGYVVVTLHRPSNVDVDARLTMIAEALVRIAESRDVVFAAHPRTQDRLRKAGVGLGGVRLIDPLPYFHMLDLVEGAHVVVTDSGGLQEETTALGVPCLTVRDNTERPITITEGTNQLVLDPRELSAFVEAAFSVTARCPEGWDGSAGERVVDALTNPAYANPVRGGAERLSEVMR
ncbi:MAG: UDP-N-acetylglucosamine 2-epimerase (non-hydrolyzing) [Gemmatimonadota bacterium]